MCHARSGDGHGILRLRGERRRRLRADRGQRSRMRQRRRRPQRRRCRPRPGQDGRRRQRGVVRLRARRTRCGDVLHRCGARRARRPVRAVAERRCGHGDRGHARVRGASVARGCRSVLGAPNGAARRQQAFRGATRAWLCGRDRRSTTVLAESSPPSAFREKGAPAQQSAAEDRPRSPARLQSLSLKCLPPREMKRPHSTISRSRRSRGEGHAISGASTQRRQH